MQWMNSHQLEKAYADENFRRVFAECYGLTLAMTRAVTQPGYDPPHELSDSVALTDEGQEWARVACHSIEGLPSSLAKLAVFCILYDLELLVDVVHTDRNTMRRVLGQEAQEGRLRYPWVFRHDLYDRYFLEFPIQTDQLAPDQTQKLLEGTPQGVFQLGQDLVGPLGLLQSATSRFLPPQNKVYLWHCSDPSCRALHSVRLMPPLTKLVEAVRSITTRMADRRKLRSEWDDFYLSLFKGVDYYDDMGMWEMPWLVANGLSTEELRVLASTLLASHPGAIRSQLLAAGTHQKRWAASPSTIAEGLSTPECLQVVLVVSDQDIARVLDRSIDSGSIRVPYAEVRTSMRVPSRPGWHGVTCECSSLGVRVTSRRRSIGPRRLQRLVLSLHADDKDTPSLQWKLRHTPGSTVGEKLEVYIHSADPSEAVKQLIMTDATRLLSAVAKTRMNDVAVPANVDAEERFIKRLLWKLGFDVYEYPPMPGLFWRRIDRFKETARSHMGRTENDREAIRSAAVNSFVSLEDVLDTALSFSTWMLLSDHYGGRPFCYNPDTARSYMTKVISGERLGSNDPVSFDSRGRNTLYPLTQGFAILANKCTDVLAEPEKLLRPKSDLPGFLGRTDLVSFPLMHTALVLDVRAAESSEVIRLLKEVTATLEGSQVHATRNSIEHNRSPDDFPAQEQILACCAAMEAVVRSLETSGMYPLVSYAHKYQQDSFNRGTVEYKDYLGRIARVLIPAKCDFCGLPSEDVPQVVVHVLRVGDSSNPVRFAYRETSGFTELWNDYPKLRPRDGSRLPVSQSTPDTRPDIE